MRAKEEHSKLHSLWRSVERKYLYLLRQKNTKATLLQIHAFMLRHSIETNLNLFTKFITACGCISCLSATKHDRRNITFLTLAKSCALNMATWEGLQIHNHVMKFGFCLDLYVSTALLDMYAKLGTMGSARKVFEEMPERSVVSWKALICGYDKAGDMERAKMISGEMPEEDSAFYNAMIDGYVKLDDLGSARSLFDKMSDRDVISWTSMINGYCNGSDVVSARNLFDSMPEKNLVSWNAMIAGYCRNRQRMKL
ncbi:Detected protein of unknown function [Hibiscus syriacus]|uniref:Pentatricopeptide repeat-containing protein n=1 Tax=Hibiscus syriacus TaxID=106335 RepID=A0A6A2ZY74_HIBSY|nr:Detected protein of unknown function [Hibiscus syriacus]